MILNSDSRLNRFVIDPENFETPEKLSNQNEYSFDFHNHSVNEPPAFWELTQAQKLNYISWLSNEPTKNPTTTRNIALYLFGIEHRIFQDPETDPEEIPELIAIVEKLNNLGFDKLFRYYAIPLIEAAKYITNQTLPLPNDKQLLHNRTDIPLSLKIHLNNINVKNKNFGPGDCFSYFMAQKTTFLSKAAYNEFNQFKTLWISLFQEKYPNGIPHSNLLSPLKHLYKSASKEFEIILSSNKNEKEILFDKRYIIAFNETLKEATIVLDSFCHNKGYKAGKDNLAQNLAYLPRKIIEKTNPEFHFKVLSVLNILSSQSVGVIKTNDILSILYPNEIISEEDSKIESAKMMAVASLLDQYNIGHEPDYRFTKCKIQPNESIVIFKSTNGTHVDPNSKDFLREKAIIDNSLYLISQVRNIKYTDYLNMKEYIWKSSNLDINQKKRIIAHSLRFIHGSKASKPLKKSIDVFTEKELTFKKIINLSNISSHLSLDGIKAAEKMSKLFNINPANIHSLIFNATSINQDEDEPVTIAREIPEAGFTIPRKNDDKYKIVNQKKIKAIENDTKDVSQMLSKIFLDEIDSEEQIKEKTLSGLDTLHSSILMSVLNNQKTTVTSIMKELEKNKTPLEGAIETINDWAFDFIDDTFIEINGDALIYDPQSVAIIKNVIHTSQHSQDE